MGTHTSEANLTQPMGLALGIEPADLGFDRHTVSVKAVLTKLGY